MKCKKMRFEKVKLEEKRFFFYITIAKVKPTVFGYYFYFLLPIWNWYLKTCLQSDISVSLSFWKSILFGKCESLFYAKWIVIGHSLKLISKISRFFPSQNSLPAFVPIKYTFLEFLFLQIVALSCFSNKFLPKKPLQISSHISALMIVLN